MKILALEREVAPAEPASFKLFLLEEAARLYDLYRQGVVREYYFNALDHTAVLVLECAGLEEARHALDAMPLVRAGLIAFELVPLAPYTGFDRLFASG